MRIAIICAIALGYQSIQSAVLSDDEIGEAIAAAKQPRFESLYVEARGPFAADFSVVLQGPIGRVMDVAREAHESYKPFAAADVPSAITARSVTALIVMHSDGRRVQVKNVVVMPLGVSSRDAAIQPLPRVRGAYELSGQVPRSWKPGYGWEPAGLPMSYRFSESELPEGDLQLIVVTGMGDRRYTVRAIDRPRMR